MKQEEPWTFRIARLELTAGDILVVKTEHGKPEHEFLSKLVPHGVKVLYIPSTVDLSVLTKAQVKALVDREAVG